MTIFDKSNCLCCIISSLIILILPLAVAEIFFGIKDLSGCNMKSDLIGFDISLYLIIMGIADLISIIFYSCMLSAIFFYEGYWIIEFGAWSSIVGSFIVSLFNITWLVIGAFVLFDENFQCIKEGSIIIIFALAVWCLIPFRTVLNCYFIKRGIKPD